MPGLATDNYAAHGARLLGATGTDVDPDSDRALQGIGLVLLAIYQHLTTGQAAPPGRRTWWPRPTAARGPQPDVSARDFTGLARIVAQVTGAGTPRRHAETLLAGYQELMAAMPPDADQPAEGPPPVLAGPEVAAVLASLWSASTWRRLEICSPSAAGIRRLLRHCRGPHHAHCGCAPELGRLPARNQAARRPPGHDRLAAAGNHRRPRTRPPVRMVRAPRRPRLQPCRSARARPSASRPRPRPPTRPRRSRRNRSPR